jgi:predicted CopG family antitoxin
LGDEYADVMKEIKSGKNSLNAVLQNFFHKKSGLLTEMWLFQGQF